MIEVTMTQEDADLSAALEQARQERAARWAATKLLWEMGVRLDCGRSVAEIMGGQQA